MFRIKDCDWSYFYSVCWNDFYLLRYDVSIYILKEICVFSMFTFTGIFLSIISDQLKNRRVIILTLCLLFWSIMTILTGFVTEFWQLVILRLGLGFGQAGCMLNFKNIFFKLILFYSSNNVNRQSFGYKFNSRLF